MYVHWEDDLLYFLNKWLIQHVVTEDLKITEYSKIAKNRPIGEDLYVDYLLSVK
jgi:hemerythrin